MPPARPGRKPSKPKGEVWNKLLSRRHDDALLQHLRHDDALRPCMIHDALRLCDTMTPYCSTCDTMTPCDTIPHGFVKAHHAPFEAAPSL
jgi:hypothetical protein